MLLHLAPGDAERAALEVAAVSDPDPLTRRAAVDALQGSFSPPASATSAVNVPTPGRHAASLPEGAAAWRGVARPVPTDSGGET